jgi:hypothetical protein
VLEIGFADLGLPRRPRRTSPPPCNLHENTAAAKPSLWIRQKILPADEKPLDRKDFVWYNL